MNKYNFYIFLISPLVLEAAFNTRYLDRSNRSEITQVCQLFDQPDVREATAYNSTEMSQLIRGNKSGVIVTEFVDGKDSKIAGVLVVSYQLRALAGFGNLKAWNTISKDSVGSQDAISFDIMATDSDFRRKGVATKMMQYVEDYAVGQDVPFLILSVFKNNVPVLACYEQHGFKKWREGDIALSLKKDLVKR
jgi:ribosomal protein S18 acetylase RimI-like enzyme